MAYTDNQDGYGRHIRRYTKQTDIRIDKTFTYTDSQNGYGRRIHRYTVQTDT